MNYKILIAALAVILVAGCTAPSTTTNNQNPTVGIVNEKVFYTDSFFVMENGKPRPQYSVKEMIVNKGDKVVVYVNTTTGTHDFNIDEFGVKVETPTGEVTKIEFIADKTGDFVYYCSKPNHRTNGHWGTLKVL